VRRSVLLVSLLVLVLSACRVDTSVTVSVRDDGTGTVAARVRLDADAVRAAETGGAKLEAAVRLGDLTVAGWKSSGWVRGKSGATLTLTKRFARAEDAGAVVAELNGPDGPLHAVRVTRKMSTFGTDWSFSGVGDLKDVKTGVGADPDLLARLSAARVDVAALDQQLLAQTRDSLRMEVTADLPHSSPRVFRVRPGTVVPMHASSSQTAMTRVLLLLVGIGVGVVAIGLLVAGELRYRRRRA
jgi:hypothetical protein